MIDRRKEPRALGVLLFSRYNRLIVNQEERTIIFTDGASKGNPGPGGWGAIILQGSGVEEFGGREEYTTNNRMELRAAISALEQVQNAKSKVTIFCDSAYVVKGITEWIGGWKKKGWMTSQKKEVENQELWQQLDELAQGLDIQWQQIAGHADTPGNARVDEIASDFAEGNIPDLFSGPRLRYGIDLNLIGGGKNPRKRGSAYSYVSLVNGVVQVHQTWEACKRRVAGVAKARFKKALSSEDEQAIIEEFKKT